MFDKQGRVWFAAAVRGTDNPAFCKKGSDHPSAKAFPLDISGRQVSMLDPKTMKYSFIDTCFGTHHPQFGCDTDNTLWLSGTGPVAGWVNTKVWDESADAAKAQGWAPWVLDTNGNGKVDEYTEPDKPAEAGKDTRIAGSGLGGAGEDRGLAGSLCARRQGRYARYLRRVSPCLRAMHGIDPLG